MSLKAADSEGDADVGASMRSTKLSPNKSTCLGAVVVDSAEELLDRKIISSVKKKISIVGHMLQTMIYIQFQGQALYQRFCQLQIWEEQ